MSSRSLPALPTKGSPVASSFSPGPSPTSIRGEQGSPVAKTVLVRLFARSHLVQTETWRASSSSRLSRSSPPSAVSKRLSKAPPGCSFDYGLFYTAGSGPRGALDPGRPLAHNADGFLTEETKAGSRAETDG